MRNDFTGVDFTALGDAKQAEPPQSLASIALSLAAENR